MITINCINDEQRVFATKMAALVSPVDVPLAVSTSLMSTNEVPAAVSVEISTHEDGYCDRRLYMAIREAIRPLGISMRRLMIRGRTVRIYGILDMG